MLVVDASVAAKWVVPEPDSYLARALRADGRTLAAPSLIVEELGNIAWKYARRADIPRDKSLAVPGVALALLHLIVPTQELYETALTLAIDLDHPIYDCFYLALACRENAPLTTADARLTRLAGVAGVKVELLGSSA